MEIWVGSLGTQLPLLLLEDDNVLLFRIEMEKGTKTKQTNKKDALSLQGLTELPRDTLFTKLKSPGHTQLQGSLGNVVLNLSSYVPANMSTAN